MRIYSEIYEIIKEDAGNRNIIPLTKKNTLYQAAQSLLQAKHIVIVTGFYIERMKTGETDGPLGAVFLAQALEKLGFIVTIMTSPFNENIMQAAIDALQLSAELVVVEAGMETKTFPKILANPDITHLVALEQMGMALDGNFYNMAGMRISIPVARFDSLFVQAREKGITTIGIGDGGNEIGMGSLYSHLYSKLDKKWIINITPVDFLITAGVSNWGGYGLAASLSYLAGQTLLHDPNEEKRLLQIILDAGAVDGRTNMRVMSVDGLPIKKHMEIIAALHEAIAGIHKVSTQPL
ncbi:DUF4392 domain-containing protein [Schinkia sp. CFF1]